LGVISSSSPESASSDHTAAPAGARLISRDFALAILANFVNSFGQQMLTATLPLYVLALGSNQAGVGLVSGALFFTAMLLRPFTGYLADLWRRRPLMIIGTLFYSLSGVVYLLAGSLPGLVLGRVLNGFGLSSYTTASSAYVADLAPARRRAEAIGLFSIVTSIGSIVAPAFGFWVMTSFGFSWLFSGTASLALAACIASLFMRERHEHLAVGREPWSARTGIVALDALPMAGTALCFGMGFGPVGAFLAIFAQARGIANPGILFTVQALAVILSQLVAGRLADRRGRAFVMVPGTVILSLGLGMLLFAHGLTEFLVAAALYGFGQGSAQPASIALLFDRVRPEQRGLAMSTYYLGFDLGISLGSIGLGQVAQIFGLEAVWPIAAGCTLLGLFGLLAERNRAGIVRTTADR